MSYVSQNPTRPAQDVTYFGRVSVFFGYNINKHSTIYVFLALKFQHFLASMRYFGFTH